MKILIGLIFLLSISFACDQPYEEFEGYKIGCKFEDKNNEFKLVESRGEFSVYQKNTDGLFDNINIIVLSGNIEGVEFRKNTEVINSHAESFSQDGSIANNAAMFVRKINEQFGDKILMDTNDSTMVWRPNSKVVKDIHVRIPNIKNDNFDVKIFSKKLFGFFYSMDPNISI